MKKPSGLILSLLGFALVGCDAMDAVQATKAMPEKMDQSLAQIEKSNRGITRTNDAIHKQKLLLALDDMFKPQNTRYLVPPTGMLPGGETFALEATTDELTKMAFVWLREVEKMLPDDSARGSDGKFPAALAAEVDHQKMVKLMALEVVAGLLPQSSPVDENGIPTGPTSVDELIEKVVNRGGRYESTVYSILMARAIFIKDILIDPLFEEKVTNLGKFEEIYARAANLDSLARLPFASKIALKTTGMINSESNVDIHMDGALPLQTWQKIARVTEKQLEARYLNDPRVKELKALVQQNIAYWKSLQGVRPN